VAVKEALLLLRGEAHHERSPGVAQTHDKHLHRLAYSADHRDGLTPVTLRILVWLKFQWDKDIGRVMRLSPRRNVLPDPRLASLVALCLEQLKYFMRSVALLLGEPLVAFHQLVNTRLERSKDMSWFLAGPLIRRGRIFCDHLAHRLAAMSLFSRDLPDTFM